MHTEHYKKQAKKNILLAITLTCQQEIAEAVIDSKEHPTAPSFWGLRLRKFHLLKPWGKGPRCLDFQAINAPPTTTLLIFRCISVTEQTFLSHRPRTLCCTAPSSFLSPFLWCDLSKKGTESNPTWPFTPPSPFTWKAVQSIFTLRDASLPGRLQLTFGFPNQLDHPDHLWQVPGQRPLLAPRPAAQGGGQHTFWGRPPPA